METGADDDEIGIPLYDISLQQTIDGGYVVLTTRDTMGGFYPYGKDLYLLKLDSRGNQQWNEILDQIVVQFTRMTMDS